MKSIKQVEITNFQSHAHTVVEFTPAGNLTVITGDSDSGKTAILRTLRWVFYNSPQGTDFIRVGCSSAKVTVTMSDGWSVARLRTPSKNQYIVAHPDGDEQVYEGFGSNVPVEVQQVLGVAPVDVGDMDLKLNIAEQLDGPFLGNSMAASFRAKVLGKLAGTEDVDVANKQLGTDLYRHNRDLETTQSNLATKTEQIEELAWVEGLGVKIAQLEVFVQTVKSKRDQLKGLRGLETKFDEVSGRISRGKEYLAKYRGLSKALAILTNAGMAQQRQDETRKLQSLYTNVVNYSRHCSERLQLLLGVEEAQVSIADVSANIQQFNALKTLSSKYIVASDALEICKERVQSRRGTEQATKLVGQSLVSMDSVTELQRLQGRYQAVNKDHTAMYNINVSLGGVQTAAELLAGTTGTITKINHLRKVRFALSEAKQSKEKTLGALELATHTLDNAAALYAKTLQEAGICPTCGATAHEYKLREVI